MQEIGSYEAKTHLPKLLKKVSRGERITITKHGRPIAMIVPFSAAPTSDLDKTIAKLKALHTELGIKGLSAKRARETGRKY